MAGKLNYLPYFAQGTVVKGFGRGSSELGIPTANFPEDVIHQLPKEFDCGVYYGWACIDTLIPPTVYKMVMCVGWNPHYQNTVKTMETHVMHKFGSDFYGENLKIIVMGYIRPMVAFDSLDALIAAMNNDIEFAGTTLDQPPQLQFSKHPFLTSKQTNSSMLPYANAMLTNGTTPLKSVSTAKVNGYHNNDIVEIVKSCSHDNLVKVDICDRTDGSSVCREGNSFTSDKKSNDGQCESIHSSGISKSLKNLSRHPASGLSVSCTCSSSSSSLSSSVPSATSMQTENFISSEGDHCSTSNESVCENGLQGQSKL